MREEIKEIRRWAKKEGVRVLFKRLKGAIAGQAYYEDNLIVINSLLSSRTEMLSTFAHERKHLQAYQEGLWQRYHGGEKDPRKLAQIGLKVEKWIDREAAILLYNYDKRVRYLSSYLDSSDEDNKEFLKNFYENQ